MTWLGYDRYCTELEAEAGRIADAVHDADLALRVPDVSRVDTRRTGPARGHGAPLGGRHDRAAGYRAGTPGASRPATGARRAIGVAPCRRPAAERGRPRRRTAGRRLVVVHRPDRGLLVAADPARHPGPPVRRGDRGGPCRAAR